MTTATATTPELITLENGKFQLLYPDGQVVGGPEGEPLEVLESWLEYRDSSKGGK